MGRLQYKTAAYSDFYTPHGLWLGCMHHGSICSKPRLVLPTIRFSLAIPSRNAYKVMPEVATQAISDFTADEQRSARSANTVRDPFEITDRLLVSTYCEAKTS